MIKYISVDRSSYLVKFNKDNDEITTLENSSSSINWMWIADEDGELDGKKVEKGDVILKMYGIGCEDRELIIIKDEALKDYYRRLSEYWESKKLQDSNCECCDCCPKTCCR